MNQWSMVKRYCVFVLGMVFCALGISFVTRAGLGTSPVSGLPFVLSLITEISMGTFTFLFNMLFLILEAVIRRKLGFLQLLQIPMTFCFSFFIDCFYEDHPDTVWRSMVSFLCISCDWMCDHGIRNQPGSYRRCDHASGRGSGTCDRTENKDPFRKRQGMF